jgi:hypothetical protein
MSLVVPNVGEVTALSYLVGKTTTTENLVLGLYTNNVTPGESDTAGTYTEASGFGYSAITLTGASWTITPGAPTTASYPQQTFTFTGAAGNMYGYYLRRASSLDLVYAERFSDGPYNVVNNGDTVKVTATIGAE